MNHKCNHKRTKTFHCMTNCQRSYLKNLPDNIFGPPHHPVHFNSKVFTSSRCKVVADEVSFPVTPHPQIQSNETDAACHLHVWSVDRTQSLFLICRGFFSGSKHAIPSQIGPKFFLIRQFFIDCQSQRRNVHQLLWRKDYLRSVTQ